MAALRQRARQFLSRERRRDDALLVREISGDRPRHLGVERGSLALREQRLCAAQPSSGGAAGELDPLPLRIDLQQPPRPPEAQQESQPERRQRQNRPEPGPVPRRRTSGRGRETQPNGPHAARREQVLRRRLGRRRSRDRRRHLHLDRVGVQRPVLLLHRVEDVHRQRRHFDHTCTFRYEKLLDCARPGHLTLLDGFLVGRGRVVCAQAGNRAKARQPQVADVPAPGRDQPERDRLPDRDVHRIDRRPEAPLPDVARIESRRLPRRQRLHLQRDLLRLPPRAAAREEHAEPGQHLDLGRLDRRVPRPEREQRALPQ